METDDSSDDEDECIVFSDTIIKHVRFDSVVVIHEVSRLYSANMWITAQEIEENRKAVSRMLNKE
jgi:ribosomal protein L16/L10AE